jgi:hypothetical protein
MQFRTSKHIASGLIILLTGFACSSVKVIGTEPAENFQLADYRTFDFYQVEASGDTLSQAFTERVGILQTEITQALEKRGLSHRTTNPDLLINLGVVVNEKVQTRQTDIRTDPPNYVGQRRYTWQSQEVEVGRYREGTVSVHLVDRQRNALVWQGTAEGVVPAKTNQLQKQAAEGVEKLFSRLTQ